jgi:competence protein ComFC
MKSLLKALSHSFLSLLYPPLCLHCETSLSSKYKIFCADCLGQFEVVLSKERCPFCFSSDLMEGKRVCDACLKKPTVFTRVLSAYDFIGPAATLELKLKSLHSSFLTEGASALMAHCFLKTSWPLPDFVVPVQQTFLERLVHGYNPNAQLAKNLAIILNRPYLSCLNYRPFHFKINEESETMREKGVRFRLLNRSVLEDKSILLVADLLTNEGRMQECARALAEGHPEKIYGLTLCRAM